MREIQIFKNVLKHIAVLLLFNIPSACFLFNPDVHYILPNAYVGMFKIILDEANGIEVKKNNGRYVYEIPENGILRVKSFAPFRDLHEETASFKDGTKILMNNSSIINETVALRSGSEYEIGAGSLTKFMVLGTEQQLAFIYKKKQSDDEFDKNPPEFYNQQLKQIK